LAWVFKHLWNTLHLSFPQLPKLTYRRALIVALFWGLTFNLILLMISGARELLTPGAWKRSGVVYELTDPAK
jgi:hypothetical protein